MTRLLNAKTFEVLNGGKSIGIKGGTVEQESNQFSSNHCIVLVFEMKEKKRRRLLRVKSLSFHIKFFRVRESIEVRKYFSKSKH